MAHELSAALLELVSTQVLIVLNSERDSGGLVCGFRIAQANATALQTLGVSKAELLKVPLCRWSAPYWESVRRD